jgi:hypothetical protein
MNIWPMVASYYKFAANGGPVYATLNYGYHDAQRPGEPRLMSDTAFADGRMNSFVDFRVDDGGGSELTLGLLGRLDAPFYWNPKSFYPMELEIRLEPQDGTVVTTVGGAPDRRAGGDVTFDDNSGAFISGPNSYCSGILKDFRLIYVILEERPPH